ncbi:MAG: ATP-binding protein [Nanoarchaeota archaeon]|nr:ATP-binding protein [Nanoarchaeota archaeon]MBU1027897.1 ATP-binding protein [Nanoarchaeota archaeon]
MLSESEIKEILIRQKEVILNKEYGIERTVLREVESKIKLPHVVVLTGLRRSGKSTLLRQLIKKHYNDEDFYYLNFEDERLFNFPASEFNRLYEALVSLYGKKKTFFLDEIQNITNFETFVRRLYEEGFKFFITGSSATLLSRELGTKLTGRHVDIVVRPFSFLEFLKLKGVEVNQESIYKTETKIKIKKYFEGYLIKGGMPEYLIYNDSELLTRVYEDTIIKDIAVRHKVNNVIVLRQLYSYLINNFSNKFSYNSIKKVTNIKSVNTIKKFISYLEETYLAKTINKFDYSYKKQIINDKKFYILDNGFIEILSKKITKDHGWLLENLVFNCLNKDNEIFYYSDKKECDFLIIKNKSVKQTIQVCYELNEENREREIEGLTDAMEKFKLKKGLLLTNSQEEDIKIKGKKIHIRPVWKWLLQEK